MIITIIKLMEKFGYTKDWDFQIDYLQFLKTELIDLGYKEAANNLQKVIETMIG